VRLRRRGPRALEGRDGWLFLTGDSNDVIGQHTARRSLPAEAMEQWRVTLERRRERFESRDVPYAMFLAPDKEAMYPEYLPPDVVPVSPRPMRRLQDHLAGTAASDVLFLLEPALRKALGRGIVYPKTDTHWSAFGAFQGSAAMCARMGLEHIDEKDVDWRGKSWTGDLGEKCSPPRSAPTLSGSVRSPQSRRVFDNEVVNRGTIRVFEKDPVAGPVGLLFGDSFAYYLLEFLAESFGRLVYAHSITVDWELVDEVKPDVAMSLAIERFCFYPPDDDAARAVRAIAAEKLGRLRG